MTRKLSKFLILFDNTNLLYFPGHFLSGRVLIELDDEAYVSGLHFHVVGEGVVRVRSQRAERVYDKENYIDFRMRLLGEPGFCGLSMAHTGYVSQIFQFVSSVLGSSDTDQLINRKEQRWLASAMISIKEYEHLKDFLIQEASASMLHNPEDTNWKVCETSAVCHRKTQHSFGSEGPSLLSPGIHSFPFKLGLPLGLPSTFLGKHGWVQYYCKAALREPGGLTHKNQQVFIVMNPIDLNLEPPILAQPARQEIEQRVGVSCVSGGPVFCRVSLDRGGYVPGETIGISATVSNRSKVTMKSTKASLTETIQYLCRGKVLASEARELASVSRGKIRPGEGEEWLNEQMYVPPLPPTNLRGCHLINVLYHVYFVISPKSLDKEIKLQIPIVLATYPLRQEGAPIGSAPSKRGAHYPSTLPIFRPWLDDKAFQVQE